MYDMIFKRKSFHLFRGTGAEKLTEAQLAEIRQAYDKMVPLCPGIRTAIRIVPASEKLLGRGAEYAIEIYSEQKDNHLANAGYLGQQLDLYLVSQGIASLWFGLGKPEQAQYHGMSFVIMILIAKADNDTVFRKDMFRSKRKPLAETWQGNTIPGVSDIARFAPSACNSQPWRVKAHDRELEVYRYRKPGKTGIIPAFQVGDMNRIDMGIYLYILELCLEHENISFTRELHTDPGTDAELTLNACYRLKQAE